MARNTVRIYTNIAVSSCSGSGPAYTINYGSSVANVQVGDIITVYKMEAGGGAYDSDANNQESTYTYRVTGITDSDTLTITYVTDTNGDGDDSPCDLPSGTGSSGSPNKAPHTFDRNLGSPFLMFVE
jgi:hypothetical protein